MNVFVLCTGRCGSTTFSKAASHIENFTSAHESRTHFLGNDRFNYSVNHIEADNRLSWLLGRLDKHYGNNAYYVHLQRNTLDTARSFVKRFDYGIMKAYRSEILMNAPRKLADVDQLDFCVDYCETVNTNIQNFLANKTNVMPFYLETAKKDWHVFWNWIGAVGDFDASLTEWDTLHNQSS